MDELPLYILPYSTFYFSLSVLLLFLDEFILVRVSNFQSKGNQLRLNLVVYIASFIEYEVVLIQSIAVITLGKDVIQGHR